MIVRVMEEDQYRLDDGESAHFEQLDQALMAAVQADDQVQFISARDTLLAFVREHGDKVPLTEIVPSDVVVPAEDITLQEARELLTRDDAAMGDTDAPSTDA